MRKVITLISCLILIISCGQYKTLQTPNQEMNIDELFKSWNLASYKSLETQTQILTKTKQYNFKSKLDEYALKYNISNIDKINKEAIRYKFLEELTSTSYSDITDYCIVEADISGEYYLPRIFVMYSRNKKSTNVIKYEYNQGKWKFKDSFLLPYFFKYNFKDYTTNYGKELNWHDITITQIIDNKVIRSDFILTGTMSKFVFELPEFANHY